MQNHQPKLQQRDTDLETIEEDLGESERTSLEKIERKKHTRASSNAFKPKVDDQIFSKLPLR